MRLLLINHKRISMKINFTLGITLLFGFVLQAQTIVSTTAQNKKVILEEFTGIYCGYCPQGHAVAEGIKQDDPNNIFIINIHDGPFANPDPGDPDYTTPFGWPIILQSDVYGYPGGTINRTVFSAFSDNPGGTAMGRFDWEEAADITKAQSSYVNVALEANINVQTNELTVHVEVYYTGSSPVSSNKLNVALLQNNTKGPQSGGYLGNEYNHQHRLVHLITGQWGENITTTAAGTFVDRTYTYTLPTNYNSIPVDIAELELVAFVAETQQSIISGNGAKPTYSGIVGNDVNLKSIANISSVCTENIEPKITIQNISPNPLTNLPITYKVNNGAPQIYNWTGSIGVMKSQEIQFPISGFNLLNSNSIEISVPTDSNVSNNIKTQSFDSSVVATTNLTLSIITDNYGYECSWNFKNSQGVIVQSGPISNYSNNSTFTIPITLDNNECFTFNLIDDYGDGGCTVNLKDSNNTTIYSTTGEYGSGESKQFATGSILSSNLETQNEFFLYPNPSNGLLKIKTPELVEVIISDFTGKSVFKASNIENEDIINLTHLTSGVYFVKISSEFAEKNQKIIIK